MINEIEAESIAQTNQSQNQVESFNLSTEELMTEIDENYQNEIAQLEEKSQNGEVSKNTVLQHKQSMLTKVKNVKSETTNKRNESSNHSEVESLSKKITALENIENQLSREINTLINEIEAESIVQTNQNQNQVESFNLSTEELLTEIDGEYLKDIQNLETQLKDGTIEEEEILQRKQTFLIKIGDLESEIADLRSTTIDIGEIEFLDNKSVVLNDLKTKIISEIEVLEREITAKQLAQNENNNDLDHKDDFVKHIPTNQLSDIAPIYEDRDDILRQIEENPSLAKDKRTQNKLKDAENRLFQEKDKIINHELQNIDSSSSIEFISVQQIQIENEKLIEQYQNEKDFEKRANLAQKIHQKQNELIQNIAYEKQLINLTQSIDKIIEENNLSNTKSNDVLLSKTDIINEQIEIERRLLDINSQLNQLRSELSSEKKSERIKIEDKISVLEKIKKQLEDKSIQNQEYLSLESQKETKNKNLGISEDAIQNELTYQEEVEIAKSEEYHKLFSQINRLKELQYERKVKQETLEATKNEIQQLMPLFDNKEANPENEEMLGNYVDRVNRISIEIGDLEIEIEQLQAEIRKQNNQISQKEKTENLLARDVAPIKEIPMLPVVASGLITNNSQISTYSASNPIPEIEDNIKGLFFRVQIGAFGYNVPENTFSEFHPIAKEPVRPGLIRYVAGLFGSEESARTARDQIRSLGYDDAFLVAYCDGERIPIYRARELIRTGACVPGIIDHEQPIISSDEIVEKGMVLEEQLDEFAYNKGPNAAKADAAEAKMGLYFTVQVGVYNHPVSSAQLYNISPLITKRLPNGQIRYSSGIYNSVKEAVPHRTEARQKGITDAFITAYFQGKRITIAEAEQILAEKGNDILELNSPTITRGNKIINKETPSSLEEVKDPFMEDKPTQYMLVSNREYYSYPSQELNLFNQSGDLYYYDSISKRIKGFITDEKPTIFKQLESDFRIEEVYQNIYPVKDKNSIQKEEALQDSEDEHFELTATIEISQLHSDLMDAILTIPGSKKLTKDGDKIILSLYLFESSDAQKIINSSAGLLEKLGARDINILTKSL